MSLAISDSEFEAQSSEEDVGLIPETQVPSVEVQSENDSDTQRQRRSSRVTRKRLAGWPIHRILEELYVRKISVPAGLNHEKLFDYLLTQDNPTDDAHRSSNAENPVSAPPKGHDVNLVKIILSGSETADKRYVDCGEFSVVLKDSDPRLSKTLTLAEFNVAFGVFRDTIYEVYPLRREELDTYLAIISEKRLIIDLSAPHNSTIPSINSLIPKEPFSLFYASIDNAIQMIKLAGVGAWLGKADITDAFKVLPLHPSQWHLFCIKWNSKFYYSVKLTFGCRSSPSIFNTLSEALCWILYNSYKLPFVLHLLDNFLVIDFPSSPPARNISAIRNLFSELGVPLSEEKTIGPSTHLDFLGITLDSLLMQASLPQEKISRIRAAIKFRSTNAIITKRDLLSLLGHPNFAMRIIPHGRSFISRLIELAYSVQNLNDLVVLDEGCQADLRFWSLLCEEWNGISFFYNDFVESSDSIQFFTDAAPSVGFGGFYNNEWFADVWPTEIHCLNDESKSTALYELYLIVVACTPWGKKLG
ncbi:LOW QUALITY PROTEIN: uncharacterized protein LOC117767731 [Hippoglossus hippoglossus]|uniref:LOW QUALITY PROTEIN: uncharacterized protein LOC117767731 n=1 Tax=Hippoglossus hippoglossus TaxID=8267 RepID=UPI00148CE106|nr:LOW QUALITY PROTEIN: uncharacterized protein LOC117767731 [Hippoglossus hippoglossus]